MSSGTRDATRAGNRSFIFTTTCDGALCTLRLRKAKCCTVRVREHKCRKEDRGARNSRNLCFVCVKRKITAKARSAKVCATECPATNVCHAGQVHTTAQGLTCSDDPACFCSGKIARRPWSSAVQGPGAARAAHGSPTWPLVPPAVQLWHSGRSLPAPGHPGGFAGRLGDASRRAAREACDFAVARETVRRV